MEDDGLVLLREQLARLGAAVSAAEGLELERIRGLEARTAHGDEQLREHCDAQHALVTAALNSAVRERMMQFDASQQAIATASAAMEKRMDAVNEFRAQLGDQAATFLPREVADSQFADLRKTIQALTDRMNTMQGSQGEHDRARDAVRPWALWAAGGGLTVVISVVIFVANVLTSG